MEIIDLTGTISEDMWCYGNPFSPFSRKMISDLNSTGYFAYEYRLFSHMGTHIDSLAHFEDNAPTIQDISLDILIGTAIVIEIKNIAPLKEINLQDIGDQINNIKKDDIVLFYTGWDKMWERNEYASQTPYLSNEVANLLVEKRIKLVATDTALCCSPIDGLKFVSKEISIPDKILLKNGIPYINGLVNLRNLCRQRIQFMALPLKIKFAEGTPVRAIAILYD